MLIIAIDRGRILSLEWVEGYLWVGLGDGSIVSFFFFHFRFMLCIYRCSLSLSLSLSHYQLVLDSTRDWAVIKDWRAHNTGVMHLQRVRAGWKNLINI